jgi:hypothetical protein
MMKDRAQKASALRLCVSKRWLPQLEVEVEPATSFEKSKSLLTDLDVLGVAPSPFGGHVRLVFDCKSGVRESAIGRAFWLHGVMARVSGVHGFVMLNDKVPIHRDHRVSATDLAVSLLHESEFVDLAKGMGGTIATSHSTVEMVEAWDEFTAISQRVPSLTEYCRFARAGYWMTKDHGEQCRKTVARLRAVRGELDPAKPEHVAIFGDALCLFLLALSELANRLFLVLLRPASKEEFSSSLLSMIYGGYDNLEVAQKIRRLAAGADPEASLNIFPEIEKFEHLVRELIQAPRQVLPAALFARELSLSFLGGKGSNRFQQELAIESPYSPKFVFMASDYLQKAIRLPPEFSSLYSNAALSFSNPAPRNGAAQTDSLAPGHAPGASIDERLGDASGGMAVAKSTQ